MLSRLIREPPFRLAAKALIKWLPVSQRTKSLWATDRRPPYLTGVIGAVDQAKSQGIEAISVFEFGVAGGNGLVALARCAASVERETGVRIKAYGFDTGSGLPDFCGDYRDAPDAWQPGDFPMDEAALRAKLPPNATLVIGKIADTLPVQMPLIREPIGFVAIDLDLYSATRDALKIFTTDGAKMLMHVPMYFDDLEFFFMHRFAGEFLAIDEFNASHESLKIDRWRGIESGRPFPEHYWLKKMYVAHDLAAISKARVMRKPGELPIDPRA